MAAKDHRFTKSFHGRTSLAVAATDNPALVAPVNQTPNVIFLPFNDEEALEACFKEQGNEISSVIIEGIQGVGGINVASDVFYKPSADCVQNMALYSLLTVYSADTDAAVNSFTGFLRCGCRHLPMVKGMGNGFPVAGITIVPQIQSKHFMLGTTFWR